MAKEERVDGSRGPVKLPWIAGGIIGLVLVCGCAGGLSAVLVFGGAGEQGGGEGGEGLKERMAIRWAALSHKFHSDPFSAPSGSTVHINQSQAMGPRPLDETIINVAKQEGYAIIGWTVDSTDWTPGATAERVYKQVTRHVCPGAIIVMHDMTPIVAEALPRILDFLVNSGYQFVPLSELLLPAKTP